MKTTTVPAKTKTDSAVVAAINAVVRELFARGACHSIAELDA